MKLENAYDRLSEFKSALKNLETKFKNLEKDFGEIGVEISCSELNNLGTKILIWKKELFVKEYNSLVENEPDNIAGIAELKIAIDELEEEIQNQQR